MDDRRALRVLYVSPYYDKGSGDPVDSLDRFPILTRLPAEMRRRGQQVRVLSLGPCPARHEANGVRYRWQAPARPARLLGTLADRWKPHYGPAYYTPSLALARQVRALRPDIVHVFGLTIAPQLALINLAVGQRSQLVVHYHGGLPPDGRLRRLIQNLALRGVNTALFTSINQAGPWIEAGFLEHSQARQLMETSSPFSGMPRDEAQAITGMHGDPVYLSAGRLHPIKDPLTMLMGFEEIARRQPRARLYLYYLTGELLSEAQELARSSPLLRKRVEFRGRAAPDKMEAIYSSADVLLQASLREWSGLAILEAMSCGCIPVLSDIPAFSAMTAGGVYGRLFPPGDAGRLAEAALSIANPPELSAAIKTYFDRELSFGAMAGKLERIYRELLESR